jgi:hypothetical protein
MKQIGIATDAGECVPETGGGRSEWGYHPRGDRKSAQVTRNRADSELPLRKRVRNLMIMLGLQGCDRRERAYVVYRG